MGNRTPDPDKKRLTLKGMKSANDLRRESGFPKVKGQRAKAKFAKKQKAINKAFADVKRRKRNVNSNKDKK